VTATACERRFRLELRQPRHNLATTHLHASTEPELLRAVAFYVPAEAVRPLAWKAWWRNEVTTHGLYTLVEEAVQA